jgi:DTW domain-containing protein YfiP
MELHGEPQESCPRCDRLPRYCVCEFVYPLVVKTGILVLQHPQEPGVDIGTVPIIAQTFPDAVIKTGLSWPNLKKALGREVDPQRWGVLYLGSVHTETLPPGRTLFTVDKKGAPLADQDQVLNKLEGIVLLDGTWSQAKTLWWRNAWLLKLRRLVIHTRKRSLYDPIRKEPRKGCLSTLETTGEVLSVLEKRDDIAPALERPLKELVARLTKHRPPGRLGKGTSGGYRFRRK